MKEIKICTPVIGKMLQEFLENLHKVQKISEFIELRVDSILDFKENDLELIRKKTIKEAIFTSRKKEVILKAFDLGFEYIDIEFSLMDGFNLPKIRKTKIITSFHDFKKTPNQQELSSIVDHLREYNVEIKKIATLVNDEKDIDNLFKILLDKKIDDNIIIVGMGEKGRLTRIFGPLLGSYLTYASTPYGETASGQIDIFKLKQIYKLLYN